MAGITNGDSPSVAPTSIEETRSVSVAPENAKADSESTYARRIDARVGGLFGDCIQVFHAFGELAELSENLRILSLNAELAAGRAGDKGRAVRALTQYTRELVNRLAQIQSETGALMGRTYGLTAAILREIHQFRLIDRACGAVANHPGEAAAQARHRLESARDDIAAHFEQAVGEMVASVERLAARTLVVAEVVSASDSIATNIAIEAVGAGPHEAEFRTVADTMRRYVEELRSMIEMAGTAVRNAAEKGAALRRMRLVGAGGRGVRSVLG